MTNRDFWAILTITLLPLVPAILLFKILPSKAAVRGPLKGLIVNLSGAFGGYFLLFLLLLGSFRYVLDHKVEVWDVRGKLRLADGFGDPASVNLLLDPPNYSKQRDGSFRLRIVRSPGLTQELEFPSLVLEAQGYLVKTIDLESEGKHSAANQSIQLGNVKLERVPELPTPYNDDQTSLTSLVSGAAK